MPSKRRARTDIEEQLDVTSSSNVVHVDKILAALLCQLTVVCVVLRLDARLSPRDQDHLPSSHDCQRQPHHERQDEQEHDQHPRRVRIRPAGTPAQRPLHHPYARIEYNATAKAEPRHEQHKVALVAKADTLVEPRTVVVELERTRLACPAVVGSFGLGRCNEGFGCGLAKPATHLCFAFVNVIRGKLRVEGLGGLVGSDLLLDLAQLGWEHGERFDEGDFGALATHASEGEEVLVVVVDFFFIFSLQLRRCGVLTWTSGTGKERVARGFVVERGRCGDEGGVEIVDGEREVALGMIAWRASFAAC